MGLEQFLSLHSFPDDVERVGDDLADGADSTQGEVDVPFGVVFGGDFFDFLFHAGEDEEGAAGC